MSEALRKASEQAIAALELAQNNLRPHGENCFLHDEGEYNSCFCGLEFLMAHLLEVTESLATALADQTPPPHRGPLTPEEIWNNDEIMSKSRGRLQTLDLVDLVRAIEAAHGIKDQEGGAA